MQQSRLETTRKVMPVMFILMTGRDAAVVTNAAHDESSLWETIERIGSDQLIGLLLIVGLAVALAIVGLRCLRAIASAVKESREYESRLLTSLYYNRVDEAINAADSFANSPVAAVVGASFQWPVSHSPANPAFQRALIAQTNRLKRSLWLLTAIGWSSTAVGLITSLLAEHRYPSGPPIPLCLGLGIAVPAIWLYRGLCSQADLLLFETDRMSLSIVEQIGAQLDGESAKPAAWNDHDVSVQEGRNIRRRPGV
jgi:hypothetical protein